MSGSLPLKQYIDNMDDEVRCGHLVTSTVKRAWNVQLNLAVKLLEVCERHGLKIWASGGTALGATRHKGFIPWDDDMDFNMLRPDYDKFVAIAKDEFKSPYFFQTIHNDPCNYGDSMRLMMEDTTFICSYHLDKLRDTRAFIAIDIFVRDTLPESYEEKTRIINESKLIKNYIWNRRRWKHGPMTIAFTALGAMRLGRKAFWSSQRLFKDFEDKLRKGWDESLPHSYLLFEYNKRWDRAADFYDETVMVPFEKIMLPIPARNEEGLAIEYGDWRKLIKGGALHSGMVLDADRSYTYYIDRLAISRLKLFGRECMSIVEFLKYRTKRILGKA